MALDDGEVTGRELVVPPLLSECNPEAVDHAGAALGWEIRRIPGSTYADTKVVLRQGGEMSPDPCCPLLANSHHLVQWWAGVRRRVGW